MKPLFVEGAFDYANIESLKSAINAILYDWQLPPMMQGIPESIAIPGTGDVISIDADSLTVSLMTDSAIPDAVQLIKTLSCGSCDGLMFAWGELDIWQLYVQKPLSGIGVNGLELVLKAAGPLTDAETMATNKEIWNKLAAIDETGKTNDTLRTHFVSQVLTRAMETISTAI